VSIGLVERERQREKLVQNYGRKILQETTCKPGVDRIKLAHQILHVWIRGRDLDSCESENGPSKIS
jgi:hypothetical protein